MRGLWLCILLIMFCLNTSRISWGQDESLETLIAGAQKKMVKVFGATAGRVEGYGHNSALPERQGPMT